MRRPAIRDLAIVLGASWLARVLFVAAIGDAHSNDVEHWELVLRTQDEGENPYETGVLNWPPFWLQVIVAIDYVTNLLGVSFWSGLRIYLVLVESLLVAALYFTLVVAQARRDAVRRALLVGIALNPVTIILVCQHGNFDVTVGLLATLAVAALAAHERSRDIVLWLAGCLLLGLAVLAKTAPLVLAPLLAPTARVASRVATALGVTLLLLPAVLAASVIAVLVPTAFFDHIVAYRSTRGFWGFAGLLEEVTTIDWRYATGVVVALAAAAVVAWIWRRRSPRAASYLVFALLLMLAIACFVVALDRLTDVNWPEHYGTVFTLGIVLLVAWLAYRLWREEPPTLETLFLLVAVIFMAVVAFGPGYGAHYAYWFVPALVATYVLLDDTWRRLLHVAWAVAGLTYAVEYAFVPFLGSYANAIFGPEDWITDVSEELNVPHRLVLFRVPLFAMYLVLIAAGVARLAALRGEALAVAADERRLGERRQ